MKRRSLDQLDQELSPINVGVNGEIGVGTAANNVVGMYLAEYLASGTAALQYGVINTVKPNALATSYYGFTQNPVSLTDNPTLTNYFCFVVAFPNRYIRNA